MIPLLLLASVPLIQLPSDAARLSACGTLTKSDPQTAVAQASEWADRDKNIVSRQCLGMALVAAERWSPAMVTFEQAAQDAETQHDGRAAALWSDAGDAALASGEPAKARDDLDHAIVLPGLPASMKGEAWIDRARADVALNDLPMARTDMDKGTALVPQDPFAWLLSATLARRQNDLPRARTDIGIALKSAADDPAVQLEAGNIAAAGGDVAAAKLAWTRAAQIGPADPAGKTAAALLAQAN